MCIAEAVLTRQLGRGRTVLVVATHRATVVSRISQVAQLAVRSVVAANRPDQDVLRLQNLQHGRLAHVELGSDAASRLTSLVAGDDLSVDLRAQAGAHVAALVRETVPFARTRRLPKPVRAVV